MANSTHDECIGTPEIATPSTEYGVVHLGGPRDGARLSAENRGWVFVDNDFVTGLQPKSRSPKLDGGNILSSPVANAFTNCSSPFGLTQLVWNLHVEESSPHSKIDREHRNRVCEDTVIALEPASSDTTVHGFRRTTATINIYGQSMDFHRSCIGALQAMQLHRVGFPLSVDTICINQADNRKSRHSGRAILGGLLLPSSPHNMGLRLGLSSTTSSLDAFGWHVKSPASPAPGLPLHTDKGHHARRTDPNPMKHGSIPWHAKRQGECPGRGNKVLTSNSDASYNLWPPNPVVPYTRLSTEPRTGGRNDTSLWCCCAHLHKMDDCDGSARAGSPEAPQGPMLPPHSSDPIRQYARIGFKLVGLADVRQRLTREHPADATEISGNKSKKKTSKERWNALRGDPFPCQARQAVPYTRTEAVELCSAPMTDPLSAAQPSDMTSGDEENGAGRGRVWISDKVTSNLTASAVGGLFEWYWCQLWSDSAWLRQAMALPGV